MSDFSNSLLRAAKELDVPAAGAKERASAQLATALTAGAVATTTVAAATTTSGLKLAALAAGAVALVLGGTAAVVTVRSRPEPLPRVGRPSVAPLATPTSAAVETAPPASRIATAAGTTPAADLNVCTMHALPESEAKGCSAGGGKAAPITVTSQCAADVDVFWVDLKCEEIFHARLATGQTFRRTTRTSHVWRIRDHATHALLKEIKPERLPGAPDPDLKEQPAPRTVPDVVITNAMTTQEEAKPALCSGMGFRTKLTLKNDRDDQISVFWVGLDCEEKYWERVQGKHSLLINGRDGDAWRIRDAKTGELLLDVPPERADYSEVITVP